MLFLRGIKRVLINTLFQLQFPALTLKYTAKITKQHVNALLDFVSHIQIMNSMFKLYNATVMKTGVALTSQEK